MQRVVIAAGVGISTDLLLRDGLRHGGQQVVLLVRLHLLRPVAHPPASPLIGKVMVARPDIISSPLSVATFRSMPIRVHPCRSPRLAMRVRATSSAPISLPNEKLSSCPTWMAPSGKPACSSSTRTEQAASASGG